MCLYKVILQTFIVWYLFPTYVRVRQNLLNFSMEYQTKWENQPFHFSVAASGLESLIQFCLYFSITLFEYYVVVFQISYQYWLSILDICAYQSTQIEIQISLKILFFTTKYLLCMWQTKRSNCRYDKIPVQCIHRY